MADRDEIRSACGALATGTVVVTGVDAGRPIGLLANSFNLVSLEPPLVLWTLGPQSSNHAAFRASRYFAACLLADGQEAVADRFGARGGEKFAGISYARGRGGVPVLDGCAAALECRVSAQHPAGPSIVMVGTVERASSTAAEPLVYHRGRYRHLAP